MNKFDILIMDSMVNVDSMLKARVKVLRDKLDSGVHVTDELRRAKRFQARYATFVRDWQYWYYDQMDGSGDKGPAHDDEFKKGTELQLAFPRPMGWSDKKMPRKKRE